ncbi:MAG TPA: peptidylprolyl isomerase [Candidatus Bathyarchaeia archaeon]|nr:peptidylprolyl isomerase [Candidatus Bathyarchaeia archaeon]
MKKLIQVAVGVVVVVAGLLVLNHFQPDRLTADRLEKAKEVQKQLDSNAEAAASGGEKEKSVKEPAPSDTKPDANVFKVKFETSGGDFVVEVHRDWAPIGAQRFEELVKANYYDGNRFFRVLPGFVVQFGLNGDPKVAAEWEKKRIKDDPVKETNAPGTITYATGGPNTRTAQLFINLENNARLDPLGFSPFGKVVEGFDVVKKINSEYREMPNQGRITAEGNSYLERTFPRLDYVKTARIAE